MALVASLNPTRMRAGDLISDEIPTLDGGDNALFAMQVLDEYKMKHLPVRDGMRFLGLLSDAAVLEIGAFESPLRASQEKLLNVYVNASQHVYDVVKVAAEFQLSAVPVLFDTGDYAGVISIYCLVRELARVAAMAETGGIIVLEINQNDYSLSEISQIVESNDAHILSANVTSEPNSMKTEVTLKINRQNMDAVLQTFARYNYVVSAAFHQSAYDESMRDRYNELMRYLNL